MEQGVIWYILLGIVGVPVGGVILIALWLLFADMLSWYDDTRE